MADREAIQADWTSWSAFALETLHLESKLLQTDRRSRAHNHIRLIAPPSNELVSGTTTGMLVERSAHLQQQVDTSTFDVLAAEAGHMILESEDCSIRSNPGDLVAIDGTRPFRCVLEVPNGTVARFNILRLPRALVGLASSHAIGHFRSALPAARVFMTFLRALMANGERLGAGSLPLYQPPSAEMLRNLFLLEGPYDTDRDARALKQLQARIRNSLQDPDLSLPAIAASEGLSTRTLQRLFQGIGTTPWAWILEQRLAGAAGELRAQSARKIIIADVGRNWGFRSASNFSRTFKIRYGTSPRRWALHCHEQGPARSGS